MKLTTLKKRSEFLRIRGGVRCPTPSFVLETRARTEKDKKDEGGSPRFGFTVTKALGKAVDRNRIRRRLKAAVREVADGCANPHNDYVLIARRSAINIPFCTMKKDLELAFNRVHHKKRDQCI